MYRKYSQSACDCLYILIRDEKAQIIDSCEHTVLYECVSVFCQSTTRGTVKDKPNFKAEDDVSALRKAIEGLGKLMSQGDVQIYTCAVYLELMSGVVSSIGTTEKTLIEVLTQRSSAQRELIAKAYEKATGRVYNCTYFLILLSYNQSKILIFYHCVPPSSDISG